MRSVEKDVKLLSELVEIDDDLETAHYEADQIILKYLPIAIREQYEKVGKWYS